jgi:uncharacterized protein (TIGR01777 family)
MNVVLWLLLGQCALGAFDSFWHHEVTERLPQKRAARRELALHAVRELLYAIVFIGLAWRIWNGVWAWVLAFILLAEVWITLADFLEEDRTRNLPRLERVVHTILAINYGVWLGVFAPHIYEWAQQPSALMSVAYGSLSWALTLAGVGVFAWSLRNSFASLKHFRPPVWVRNPLYVGNRSGRTVLITGATGFIGSALVRKLLALGDSVVVLTRDADKATDLFGPHVRIVSSLDAIEESCRIDAIVNLAGAPILALPWLKSRRKVLLDSRIETTKAIVQLCQRLRITPRVLISGSAIGYYGVRADEECDESANPRMEFQSELCRRWEAMARTAESLNVRVVLLRTGMVLGSGGALPRLALPIRCFAGAVLGSGRQWVSWIHIDDMLRVIEFSLDRRGLDGPVNATAPRPQRNVEFQKALALQLSRPLWFRLPAWPMRKMTGEMSQLLLDGQRVVPHKLGVHGFRFKYPTLKSAFANLYAERKLQVAANSAEVFFNGQCPVCSAEMSHYAKISERTKAPLCFTDSNGAPLAFARYGLRLEHLEERLYVRDVQGNIVSGLPAVLRVWDELPRYRLAAKVVRLPIIRHASIAAYDLIIAPSLARWARHRIRAGFALRKL